MRSMQAASQLTPPLAVRSSATAEDSPATAFAGVFHSELNVTPDRLADAARACWAFAFDWGAITHALRNNVDPAQVRIALLLQEMVPATRAGVLFTRDPSGAHPDEAVVSSVRRARPRRSCKARRAAIRRASRVGGPPPADPVLRRLHAAIDADRGAARPSAGRGVGGPGRRSGLPADPPDHDARTAARESRFCGRASSPRSVSLGRSRRSAGRCCRAFSASTWRRSPGASA